MIDGDLIFSLYQMGAHLVRMMERHGRDRIVVGFTTTCAISAYQH
jgi:hypothetical protein